MSIDKWKAEFAGKNILIWGYGIEGKATYRWIRKLLPEQVLTIADGGKGKEAAEAETIHTICMDDRNIDFQMYDLIMKAPGITVGENVPVEKISSEAQLFLKHYRDRTIGITGTKGKSTTTSLMYAVLKEKFNAVLVGNIGVACFDAIEQMEQGAWAAFEISCHQLEFADVSPHIGVYLNLYEEHLDHYGSFQKYGDAKFNNIKYMEQGDLAIMHKDLDVYGYIQEAPVKPVLIGQDIYTENKVLHIPFHELQVLSCRLIGDHNYQNLAVVYAIADFLGISDSQFLHAVKNFEPLHHRLEDLGIFNDIRYVNDSISTIGQAAVQALKSVDDVDVILIGGMDRGIEYIELEDYLYQHQDVQVIFMYATGKRILQELKDRQMERPGFYQVEDLQQAVTLARQICRKNHTVLLSPAASSYDHFKNFEERGRIFAGLAEKV